MLGWNQCQSLRGGKMPDVILQGLKLGNQPKLHILVVLINRDGTSNRLQEIAWASLLPGDSEYKIDGKKVVWMSMISLWILDPGGILSLLFQGRLKEIFNSNQKRRAVRAAGVLKFKTRHQGNGIVVQTQDNLDRLGIFELEGQIKPLEKQALVASVS